jgi:hypothetical protein
MAEITEIALHASALAQPLNTPAIVSIDGANAG